MESSLGGGWNFLDFFVFVRGLTFGLLFPTIITVFRCRFVLIVFVVFFELCLFVFVFMDIMTWMDHPEGGNFSV